MRLLATIALAVSMLLAFAGSASAAPGEPQVRFAHAVPGLGDAELLVDGQTVGKAGFGEVTGSKLVAAGDSKVTVLAAGGVTLESTESFEQGKSYTLVGMADGKSAEVRSFEDEAAKPGLARLRVIHGAPEFGEPNLTLNGKTLIKSMRYTEASRYWTLKPGEYELAAEDPGTGGEVLSSTISLTAGSSETALLVGSAGERSEIVLVQNDMAAPTTAPATGLGGLSGEGPDWLAALVASFAGGVLGLAGWVGFARRRGNLSG